MTKPILVILCAIVITTSAARAGHSPAMARADALSDLAKLVKFARQPATASIATLSRQFEFNYAIRECEKTSKADDWCDYGLSYSRARPAGIDGASFGHDRTSGLPIGVISWGVLDRRLCLRRADIEKMFGPGKSMPDPMPFLVPGEKVPPPLTLFGHAIGAGANVPSASALYSGECLSVLRIIF